MHQVKATVNESLEWLQLLVNCFLKEKPSRTPSRTASTNGRRKKREGRQTKPRVTGNPRDKSNEKKCESKQQPVCFPKTRQRNRRYTNTRSHRRISHLSIHLYIYLSWQLWGISLKTRRKKITMDWSWLYRHSYLSFLKEACTSSSSTASWGLWRKSHVLTF